MLTIAGNPVSSTPNGRRLDRAFESLDSWPAIDIYVNETTRHADVILPPASMLAHENYDVVFNAFAVRNVARTIRRCSRARRRPLRLEIYNGIARRIRKRRSRVNRCRIRMRSSMRRCARVRTSSRSMRSRPRRTASDLGPLAPSLMQRLETPDKKIACAPEAFVAD